MFRALTIVLLLAHAATFSRAADPDTDYHLTQDAASGLYASSAFAHGYRHGYEEGFHEADRQIHLSLFDVNEPHRVTVPKTVGYRLAFGPKDSFRKGFEHGFRAGYADSATGRDFRTESPDLNQVALQDKDFDRGVMAGFSGAAHECREGLAPTFCSGIRVGLALAAEEQRAAGTQVASSGR